MGKRILIVATLLLLMTSVAAAQSPGANARIVLGMPTTVPSPLDSPAPPTATLPSLPTPRLTLADVEPPVKTTRDFSIPPAGSTGHPSWPGGGPGATSDGHEQKSTSSCTFDRSICDPVGKSWFDNLSVYSGIDGSKEPADVGMNANFGYRFALNLGLPLVEEAGIGVQVGTSLNYSQNAIRVLRFVDGTTEHTQSFTTLGLFQRTERGLSWGIVYDYRWDEYYDHFATSQWRGQVGFDVNQDNQVGIWGTLRQGSARASLAGLPLSLSPLNQMNFFWRHVWPNEAATRVWVGFTENHGRFNLLIPGEPPVRHPFCFGADMLIPLHDSLAIFGEAQFITPNDSGTVCATVGVAWYPGAARRAARARFAPYLNVANNATMPLDLRAAFDVIALSAATP